MQEQLPWHTRQWQQLEKACSNDRLGHAILLCGPRGIGLDEFADTLAAARLCFSPGNGTIPCGECKSCVLFEAGNHPDISKIEPEEEGKQIKVDMIRELIEFITLKSQYQHDKIAVISPADAMNRAAANTLLKTLEEPPGVSLMILISHRPDLLPVTVRSRCQQIHFQPDYSDATLQWLRQKNEGEFPAELLDLAHGAPLAALEMLQSDHLEKQSRILADLEAMQGQRQDPVRIAEQWDAMGTSLVLQWLLEITADLVRLKTGTLPASGGHSKDRYSRLHQLVNRLHLYKLMQLYDLTLKNYGLSNSSISYNTQGLLEDVIICWQYQAFNPGGQST